MDQSGQSGGRFKHLLSPLTNLEKNFRVDIVKELKHYQDELNELAEHEVNFNLTSDKRFDFAEAGVLVRGTAMIYSKKVDYVFDCCSGFSSNLLNIKKKTRKAEDAEENEEGDKPTRKRKLADDILNTHAVPKLKMYDVNVHNKKFVQHMELHIKNAGCNAERMPEPGCINRLPAELCVIPDCEKEGICLIGYYHNKPEAIGKLEDFWTSSPNVSMKERCWTSERYMDPLPTHGRRDDPNECPGCADKNCEYQGWFSDMHIDERKRHLFYDPDDDSIHLPKRRNYSSPYDMFILRHELWSDFEWVASLELRPKSDYFLQNMIRIQAQRDNRMKVEEYIMYKMGQVDRPISSQGSTANPPVFINPSLLEVARRKSSMASMYRMPIDLVATFSPLPKGDRLDMLNDSAELIDDFDDDPFDVTNPPCWNVNVLDVKNETISPSRVTGKSSVNRKLDFNQISLQIESKEDKKEPWNDLDTPFVWNHHDPFSDSGHNLTIQPLKKVISHIDVRKLWESRRKEDIANFDWGHRIRQTVALMAPGLKWLNEKRGKRDPEDDNLEREVSSFCKLMVADYKRNIKFTDKLKWNNRRRNSKKIIRGRRDDFPEDLLGTQFNESGKRSQSTQGKHKNVDWNNDYDDFDPEEFADTSLNLSQIGGDDIGREFDDLKCVLRFADIGNGNDLFLSSNIHQRFATISTPTNAHFDAKNMSAMNNRLSPATLTKEEKFDVNYMDLMWDFCENRCRSTDLLPRNFIDEMDPFDMKRSVTTKLIQEWEDKIIIVLEEEERRAPFDIHECGAELLDQFDDIGEVKNFFELVSKKPKHEISRYFLSSLLMANTYNVELTDAQQRGTQHCIGDNSAINTLNVKLVSLQRHHEKLQNEKAF